MKRLFVATAIFMVVHGAAWPQRDQYGGWTELRFEARGKFYVTQKNGAWWLVTPDGSAFFSKGVNHVAFRGDQSPALGYSPYERAVTDKYGSRAKWAEAAAARLRQWDFNTVGAWSDDAMFGQKVPYALILNLAARAGANWLDGTIPDFFSEKFRDTVQSVCRQRCQQLRDDPYLLGYFTDNELAWAPGWRRKESLLATYLKLPEGSAGRKAAEAFLAAKNRSTEKVAPEDENAFLELAAREYFRACHEAIRAADPNHLTMGCRFAGNAPEAVVRGMKGFADVASFNNYSPSPPEKSLAALHEMTGAPVILTEFSFKATDSGLPNTKGAGRPVETQKDRADEFERYVTGLARLPYCVGYHWFEYSDQPKEGRFDGENSNFGLVRIDDEPWETLTERMKAVNSRIESVHAEAGKAPKYPPTQ